MSNKPFLPIGPPAKPIIQIDKSKIPNIVVRSDNRATCPVCGMAVRIVRKVDGYADHYERLITGEQFDAILPAQNPETAEKLREPAQGEEDCGYCRYVTHIMQPSTV